MALVTNEWKEKPETLCVCGHPSASHATGGKCEAYIHPDGECDCPGFDDLETKPRWWKTAFETETVLDSEGHANVTLIIEGHRVLFASWIEGQEFIDKSEEQKQAFVDDFRAKHWPAFW